MAGVETPAIFFVLGCRESLFNGWIIWIRREWNNPILYPFSGPGSCFSATLYDKENKGRKLSALLLLKINGRNIFDVCLQNAYICKMYS